MGPNQAPRPQAGPTVKLIACYAGSEVPSPTAWALRHDAWARPVNFTRCRGCGTVIAIAGGADPDRVRRWHVSTSTCTVGEPRRRPPQGCQP